MRLRKGIIVGLAALSALGLAACSSGSNDFTPSSNTSFPTPAPVTDTATGSGTGAGTGIGAGTGTATGAVAVYCTKLKASSAKITSAQTELYTGGSASAQAVATITSELKSLLVGAPSDIKTQLTDMSTSFQASTDALLHPTAANKAQLTALSKKLSTDGQKITAYVNSKCN